MHRGFLRSVVVFLVVAAGFLALRSTVGLVWNDSPQTAENLYDFNQVVGDDESKTPLCRSSGASGLRWGSPHLIKTIFARAFSCIEFGGYRPLSAALSFVAVSIFSNPASKDNLGKIWMILVALLFGLLALLLFNIARRFVQTDLTAYIILLLFFFSPPMISGSWIMFSGGIQVTVPLLICLGIWLYFKTAEAGRFRLLWQIGLFCSFIVSPWVREFTGIVPILIILLEFQKHRRLTHIITVAVFGFLHALFPTAIMSIFIPNLPLSMVFKLGYLSEQLHASLESSSIIWQILHLKWWVVKVLMLTVPPLLLLISGIALVSTLRKEMETVTNNISNILFLSVWFLLSFLPFLKVFTVHVHLLYSLMPALILIGLLTETFWIKIFKKAFSGRFSWKSTILIPLFFIALLDQMLNAYGAYITVSAMYGGIQHLADWFQHNIPRGSIIIANALHAEDIRYYSENHIMPYWSVGIGVPAERTLPDPRALSKFLSNNYESKQIYMLNIDQDFAPHKYHYHAHQYVINKNVKLASLGQIHSVLRRFPYLDPLKIFYPKRNVLFLGPPDLENDVYLGHERSGKPFLNEISVNYYLYRVTDPRVTLY
ncbi:MAG: hypothetical protein A3F16_00670 [Deltaproteobacteria bacterium RIFCSPHIGHO2_12_FULL_43_9]|nr:MAG: hypothetical protein A3F16_00670 [Deltaproteobacteria bacterium RIFCSPHIGHO2_12_FULL_43_9]